MQVRAPRSVTACAQDSATVAASLARYWLGIVPLVRRELRYWERQAQTIPDPTLRAQAVATLNLERLNVEGAAVFATLVPRRRWPSFVPMLVAFQVMYDYLDTVGEQAVDDPLRDGLQLHRALAVALDPDLRPADYYAHHPHHDDGGYLDALVMRCRLSLPRLRASPAVMRVARRAAERCSAGQAHTHAAMWHGDARLAAWARTQDRADGYRWWELAAGTISSVGVYALLAAATDPQTTAADAERIDAAYFPPICALSALLDSFIDRDVDAITANHSAYRHYPTALVASERIAAIAREAAALARDLRRGRRHAAIVSGIVAYYLSAVDTGTKGCIVARELRASVGPTVAGILATMRLRRWLTHRRRGAEG